jgi:hypothetical protein
MTKLRRVPVFPFLLGRELMGVKPNNNYALSPGVTREAVGVFSFRVTYTAHFDSIFFI